MKATIIDISYPHRVRSGRRQTIVYRQRYNMTILYCAYYNSIQFYSIDEQQPLASLNISTNNSRYYLSDNIIEIHTYSDAFFI